MTSYWCELAWLGGDETVAGVSIGVDGDRIAALEVGVPEAPPGAERLAGLTLPALANAHSHAFHRALRGRTHAGQGTFWDWREPMYALAGRLDPERYHRLARAVYAEMAVAGIGVVGEFHYVHHQPDGTPYEDPNAMGSALAAAATDAGIRLTLLDALYLHGGLGEAGDTWTYRPVSAGQVRFSDGSADKWVDRVSSLHASVGTETGRVGAAIHSARAVDPEAMEVARDWSSDAEAPLHVHVSEQEAENTTIGFAFDCTPVELLHRHGVLGPRVTVIHATHAEEPDIELLAGSGAGCCLCPTTERDLADGIGPSAALAAAGVPISVGSDSHAVIDLFEETRAVELDERLASGHRGTHAVPALATMATDTGYAALGWADGGRIEVGALADLTTVRLDSVRLAGTDRANVLDSVIFAATAADVAHVMVGGEWVVRDGRHRTVDAAAELGAAIEELCSP